jgi:outer membrane PBP1 activator LpoA protein
MDESHPGSKDIPQQKDARSLLLAAERAPLTESLSLKLQATAITLAQKDAAQAGRILSTIRQQELTVQQRLEFIQLQARLALLNDNPGVALDWLSPFIDANPGMSKTDQISLRQLRASAYYEARSFLASATELIYIDSLLTGSDLPYKTNHEKIWNALIELPEDTLTNRAKQALTSDMRGWLSLAALAKRYREDPSTQLKELKKWLQVWSHHPAAESLPSSLRILDKIVKNQPQKIAMLLPLQGDLLPYGNAIRDGFLAAHYQSKGNNESMPLISIYDSSKLDIRQVYQAAVEDGAELIIGPLDKEKVGALKDMPDRTIPVLALNRSATSNAATTNSSENFYQFGLAPEDEVIQIARQAWQEGFKRALVIVPDDEWGMRNSTIFMDEWNSLGGSIADATFFNTSKDYSKMVQSLLEVEASQKRATDLRRIIRDRFEFNARRRKDVDFILLLANPAQAKGINPTLAFFYAEDLPVYATSHINSGADSLIDYIDLNGIRFCDIPWKLTESGPLLRNIQQNWPLSSNTLAPLYALGVDVYHLYPRLDQLEQIESDKLFGMTGVLTLNDRRVINRRLTWAHIRNGKVVPMPLVINH